MPQFIVSNVRRRHNQTAFKELYEFNVLPPIHSDYDLQAVLPAFFTPEVEETHIAEELARAFGAQNPGDTVELTLQEVLFDGSTRGFQLPVVVDFASKNRGPEYIQIGLFDLAAYFEIALYQKPHDPNDRFLEISLKPDSDRDCIE